MSALFLGLVICALQHNERTVAQSLVGLWELKEVALGNTKVPDEKIPKGTFFCFTPHSYTMLGHGDSVAGSYRIDTSKQPYALIFSRMNEPNKGIVAVNLFKLEGDTLTCYGTASNNMTAAMTLKRVSR